MANACEYMFNLGALLGDALVALFLAWAQRLLFLGFALKRIGVLTATDNG